MVVKLSTNAPHRRRRGALLAAFILLWAGLLVAPAGAASVNERVESLVRAAAGSTALSRDTDGLDRVASWAAREAFSGRVDPAASSRIRRRTRWRRAP